MARLRREAHARMLGNGLCTRPTSTEFLPILVRQRDHARGHGQAERAALFDGLIDKAGQASAQAREEKPR